MQAIIEAGGQWVGPTQVEIMALLEELGIETFSSNGSGVHIWDWQGMLRPWAPEELPLSGESQDRYWAAVQELDSLAEEVPVDAPWEAEHAEHSDHRTLAEFLRDRLPDDEACAFLSVQFALTFATPPERVSLLYALFYLAGCGGWVGSRQSLSLRIVGGSAIIAVRLAASLGDRVALGSRVVGIDQTGPGNVTVETAGGRWSAGRVIVALNPAEARLLRYAPGLPSEREILHRHWQTGSAIKSVVVFRGASWVDAGLSGYTLGPHGTPISTYDSTPMGSQHGVISTLSLHAWAGSRGCLIDQHEREKQVRAAVSRRLRIKDEAIRYVERDWLAEPDCQGCESPTLPGVLTLAGRALREPAGRVHWASTETATRWPGYMNGAVESGWRAAKEVLDG